MWLDIAVVVTTATTTKTREIGTLPNRTAYLSKFNAKENEGGRFPPGALQSVHKRHNRKLDKTTGTGNKRNKYTGNGLTENKQNRMLRQLDQGRNYGEACCTI